ncbi:MAG: acetyltransferase [Sphingobacterium sp.]|jgi:acetyltransferase EpsM|uniref:acetyltransferase n=1 Tax=Sphingobacterium sp. TaxID=341027 RepID=UPI00284D1EA5|nr:acetyltransferase [Sphingobacterium sp.]MDR3011475.1 acetyltransferase [Sphingobacterium sp.]
MYLFGASGHGKVIAEIAECNNLKIEGFIDTDLSKLSLLGYPVFHESPAGPVNAVIAIGNNEVRKRIVNENSSFTYPCLMHPGANISTRSILGNGTVVMAGATINVDVNVGKHCIINTNASIDHDCIIEDFVHLSPNVALAGNVRVGEGTHIGIGACVIQGITIGKWTKIGAGAVIIKDIPDGCTVVGNPGRIIKK